MNQEISEIIIDRLKKRSDFLRLQTSPKKWISKSIIIQCAPSSPEQTSRVGFTITKRIFPRAVDRNLIRRRLKALCPDAFTHKGFDYVIIARKDALSKDFTTLKADLIWCLKKLHADIAH